MTEIYDVEYIIHHIIQFGSGPMLHLISGKSYTSYTFSIK